jgi:hypothetical protein
MGQNVKWKKQQMENTLNIYNFFKKVRLYC